MDEIESEEDLLHDVGGDVFGYFFGVAVDDVSQGASVHELDEHEETVHVVVGGDVVDDVPVGAHGHDCSLNLYLVQHLLVRHLHHSHRHALLLVLSVVRLVHCAHRPLTQLFRKSVYFIRVARNETNFRHFLLEIVIRHQFVLRKLFLFLQTMQ